VLFPVELPPVTQIIVRAIVVRVFL